MKLGLLIGAGASYEVGMPLVNELTNIVKVNILKRIHLFDFKDDKNLKEIFIFKVKNMTNYEVAIGELENMYLENHSDILHGIIIQFIECIQLLLLEDQIITSPINNLNYSIILYGKNRCKKIITQRVV